MKVRLFYLSSFILAIVLVLSSCAGQSTPAGESTGSSSGVSMNADDADDAEDTDDADDARTAEDAGTAEDTEDAGTAEDTEDAGTAEDTEDTEDAGTAEDTEDTEDAGTAEDTEDTEDTKDDGTAEDAALAGPLPGEGKTLAIGRPTWDTGWFHAEIVRQLLIKLGYTVDGPKTMDNDLFYDTVTKGTVHLWANGWFPTHNMYFEDEQVRDNVELVGYVVKAGALQGYMVDKRTADELSITNIEDFKNPEIASHFDVDGNGKADLIGCDIGWGCATMIDYHLDVYGLTDTVEQVSDKYEALMGDMLSQYQHGGSILFYSWTPSWTVGMLKPGVDVIWIEVPFSALPEEQDARDEDFLVADVLGCGENPCRMVAPPNDIRIVANKAFLEENPSVKRLAEEMAIPLEDISAQNARMFEGENSESDIERHATEWIEDNKALVDEWLQIALNR